MHLPGALGTFNLFCLVKNNFLEDVTAFITFIFIDGHLYPSRTYQVFRVICYPQWNLTQVWGRVKCVAPFWDFLALALLGCQSRNTKKASLAAMLTACRMY